MVSFAYNLGSIDGLCNNGKRTKAEIAEIMLQYVRGGGKVLPGLVRRRKMERELFLSGSGNNEQSGCRGKSLREIANEVINGLWGNGNDRVNRLKKAGCDPRKVQEEVNKILS